jgi:Ca2+-binding RTX toxin-like protein
MSTQSVNSGLLVADVSFDWNGFAEAKNHAHVQASALDPSILSDLDGQLGDGGGVVNGRDGGSSATDVSAQLTPVADSVPVDNSQSVAADSSPIPLSGADNLIIGTEAADEITGTTGIDVIIGLGGNDTIDGNGGQDFIFGGAGDDVLTGENEIYGEDGNDTIYGGDNINSLDWLHGGAGNDVLHGGDGNDGLEGGAGDDILYSDFGWDGYVFTDGWGHDQVMDFEDGFDVFDMTRVTGLSDYSQLTITASGSDTLISYSSDTFLVVGVAPSAIDAGDFFFA